MQVIGDRILLLLRQGCVERDGQSARVMCFRIGKLAGPKTALLEQRQKQQEARDGGHAGQDNIGGIKEIHNGSMVLHNTGIIK